MNNKLDEKLVDKIDKEINKQKIVKVKDYAEYVEKEIEYDLLPNQLFVDEMIELLIDIKRSAKYGRI